ncbi:hypothetical protein TNCV_1085371 [Trichonephila clavipes]|nr:hypothetical protein TNCV_1085371 [Trichonephila clavipes]
MFEGWQVLGIGVRRMWVPSHVGILGNQRADQKAKHGAELSQPEIPLTRAKSIVSTYIDKCTVKPRALEDHGKHPHCGSYP